MTTTPDRGDRVLIVATAFGQPPLPAELPDGVSVEPRRSDWGLTGARARWAHVKAGVAVARRARGFDAVVLVHAGLEAAVAGPLTRLWSPRTRLVLLDPLLPVGNRGDRMVLSGWRAFHRVVVIRRGDAAALGRRAGVRPDRVRFVPYPVEVLPVAPGGGGYVYAAGNAHRDWATLLEAVRRSGLPAVVAGRIEQGAGPPPPTADVRGPVTPEEGRRLAAAATVVAVVLRDTELPAGPLVLLDAMAMGKPIVATDVNGSRDYVEHEVDGLVVPSGHPGALADALQRLMADRHLAARLGAAARERALRELAPERFLDAVLDVVEELGVVVPRTEAPPTSCCRSAGQGPARPAQR